MSEKFAWLIYYKATLGEMSPLNLDGSAYAYGVASVPEPSFPKAFAMFQESMEKNRMELVEVYRCLRSDQKEMHPEAEEDLADSEEGLSEKAYRLNKVAQSIVGNNALD